MMYASFSCLSPFRNNSFERLRIYRGLSVDKVPVTRIVKSSLKTSHPNSVTNNSPRATAARKLPDESQANGAKFDSALAQHHFEECLKILREDKTKFFYKNYWKKLVKVALQAQRPDIVYEFASTTHSPLAWGVILQECVKKGDINLLQQSIVMREKSGLPPDQYSISYLINGFGSVGRLSDAMRTFSQAWEAPENRTILVVNAALAACSHQGDWSTAQKIVEVMKGQRLEYDVVTFNTLIKTAGAASLMETVLELYEELKKEGLSPTATTFSSIFSAASKNRFKDIYWLLSLAWEMKEVHRVCYNDHVVSALFSAASYCTCTEAHIDTLLEIFEEYKRVSRPESYAFAALLTMLKRLDVPERAVDVWTAIKQDNVERCPHLYSAVFSACAAGSSIGLVDVALEAYQDMNTWWKVLGHKHKNRKTGKGRTVGKDALVAYNALLHFMTNGRCDQEQLELAMSVYKDMKASGPAPDVITHNTMIAAAAAARNIHGVTNLYRDMLSDGLLPDEKTLGSVLNGFAKARDPTGASSIFNALVEKGLRPNVHMFTSLIEAHVKEKSPQSLSKAFELWQQMRAVHGLAPSEVTYGVMLTACKYSKDVDRAFFLYQQACDEGIVPTDEMLNLLLSVCASANKLEDAVELVKKLARLHAPMQAPALNTLTRALSRDPRHVDRALRMLSIMQTFGHKASNKTYIALITACAQFGHGDAALTLYNSLKCQGIPVSAEAGSTLIVSLCKASRLDSAKDVFADMMSSAWGGRSNANSVTITRCEEEEDFSSADGCNMAMKRTKVMPKRALAPDASALTALVQGCASGGDLKSSMYYYNQLSRQPSALIAAALFNSRVFEELIEGHCRQYNIKKALAVFDDWKGAATAAAKDRHQYPKLSYVTLAFLEACCRSEAEYSWRVFDVVAQIRSQREQKKEASLARPPKQSHHVLGALNE